MTIEEIANIINEKYSTSKYMQDCYFIDVPYMYNAFDKVSLYLRKLGNRFVITDCGNAEEHSKLSEQQIEAMCKKEGIEYDEGYLTVEYNSVDDVDKLISFIDKIC